MNDIDWQKLFLSFEGRISRQTWWIGMIIVFLATAAIQVLFGGGLIGWLLSVAVLIAALAVHVKRCHDRGKSGWWCLILLIPVVAYIWAVIDLGILEGTRGPNEYGPDPLGRA